MTTFHFDGPEAVAANFEALFIDRLDGHIDIKNAVIAEFARAHGYLTKDHHVSLHKILFPASKEEREEEAEELVEEFDYMHDWGVFEFTQTAVGVLGVSITRLKVPDEIQHHYTALANAWYKMAPAIHPIYEVREDTIGDIEVKKGKAKTPADREKLEQQSPLRIKAALMPHRSELKRHLTLFEGALAQVEKDLREHEPPEHLAEEKTYNLQLVESLKDMLVQLKKDAHLDGQGFGARAGGDKK